MTDVAVAGVGMHPSGRFPHASLKDLARVSVLRALDDAGMGVKDIQAVYSSNAMAGLLQGQEQIRGQSVLREIGIERVPVVNVENACASGSSAFREAIIAVRAGVADTVLAVGFEKMFVDELNRSLNALETAADLDVVGGLGLQFTAVYALRLRKRLDDGSLTLQDLVDVAVKSHHNGSLNPYAQHRKPVTADQVLASRPIAEPLTLLMCSSMCDGSAAAIVTRADLPSRTGKPRILVRASAAASGFTATETPGPSTATGCARQAYEEAGIGPEDIDVAEVHDAMAPGELLYYEQLGFCEPGGAADLLRSGATAIDGKIAVNPSGGLSSRGHPVGATGLAQISELVWQLRGEAEGRQVTRPRMAMAQNSGGWLEGESAASNVHILERTDPWN
ncbi:thiolase C-terminal domain-containing protein [Blastococcus saxobsidens]|uniref:Thiolase n=1 Tax=Blastococcus saxobsidens (strain DD2) TaxID=1146883 RepID=H6RNM4_BLASD|nr:thiolase [Blastococcus saxobsidens]CCG05172.1 Thiolase [Blastococcus saxobsidens DD2]